MFKNIIDIIKTVGAKGSHVHTLDSKYNDKETSVVFSDHDTGNKTAFQYEDVKLSDGSVTLIKKDGIVYGGYKND